MKGAGRGKGRGGGRGRKGGEEIDRAKEGLLYCKKISMENKRW